MCQHSIFRVLWLTDFTAAAGKEGGPTACFQHSLNARKEPYSLIVNPFQPRSCVEKWANNPRYRDPSLTFWAWFIWPIKAKCQFENGKFKPRSLYTPIKTTTLQYNILLLMTGALPNILINRHSLVDGAANRNYEMTLMNFFFGLYVTQ